MTAEVMRLRTRSTLALAGLAVLTAGVAGNASAQSQTQAITADVAATLSATVPGTLALSGSALPVGGSGTEKEAPATVFSNAAWGLKVSTNATTGRLRVWDGVTYGTALTNALEWRLKSLGAAPQSTSYADLSATPATVLSGQAPTPDTGQGLELFFRQRVSYGDSPAPGGQTYRIVVTYDAAQGY